MVPVSLLKTFIPPLIFQGTLVTTLRLYLSPGLWSRKDRYFPSMDIMTAHTQRLLLCTRPVVSTSHRLTHATSQEPLRSGGTPQGPHLQEGK